MNEKHYRQLLLSVIVIGLIFQIFVIISAQRQSEGMRAYLESIEAMLPLISRAFFAINQYWWIIPIIGAALAVDVIRRQYSPNLYAIVVATFNLSAGYILMAWTNEAIFSPFAFLATANRLA